MDTSDFERDIDWLKNSLQAAIELEFSTIPPYLCAFWSIINPMDPIAISIREIIHEEMIHMGLTCNMLSAIGGTPKLTGKEHAPSYPGPLPGGVKPEITIKLSGLNKETISTFAELEAPEGNITCYVSEREIYPSIGAFYKSILKVFKKLKPTFSIDRQITGPYAPIVITSMDQVQDAISIILRQGEGAEKSPIDTGPNDLAHYFRFMEMIKGYKLIYIGNDKKKQWAYTGEEIIWPEAMLMVTVGEDGYAEVDVPDEVNTLLTQFDKSYSDLLTKLELAWSEGDQGHFIKSIEMMFSMREIAIQLMQIPIGNQPVTYGPLFRWQD